MSEHDIPPLWLTIARGELGTREYTPQRPGPRGELSNPRVEAYQAAAGGMQDDEIPWCSSFLSWVMLQAGLPKMGTGARAWARWGDALTKPQPGAVVVLWREAPTSRFGHVGLYEREDSRGIWLLSGNAGNAVTVKPFAPRRVLAVRWPSAEMLAAARPG